MISRIRSLLGMLLLGVCWLASVDCVVADAELILSGGFETGELGPGWEDLGLPVSPSISDVYSHSGNFSMMMGYTASGVFQDLSSIAAATSNLTFWMRVPSYPDVEPDPVGSPGGIWIGIGYSDGASYGTDFAGSIESAQWREFDVPVNNSKSIANVTVAAWDVYPVYFDDFSLKGSQPIIESCGVTGVREDSFDLGETIYVNGSGYPPLETFDLYVVDDVETWIDGMSIPSRVPLTAGNVSSDSSGNILPTSVWGSPQAVGRYDIVVDVNGDGQYDENIDVLDDNDIEVTAGFVIPEFSSQTALALSLFASLLAALSCKKGRVRRSSTH